MSPRVLLPPRRSAPTRSSSPTATASRASLAGGVTGARRRAHLGPDAAIGQPSEIPLGRRSVAADEPPGGSDALRRSSSIALTRPEPPVIVDGGANAGFITTSRQHRRQQPPPRRRRRHAARTRTATPASAAVTRAEDRGVETARNWTTAFKYDRFLTDAAVSQRQRDLHQRSLPRSRPANRARRRRRLPGAEHPARAAHRGWRPRLRQRELRVAAGRQLHRAARVGLARRLRRARPHPVLPRQHDGYFGVTGDDNLFVRMQNGVRMALAARVRGHAAARSGLRPVAGRRDAARPIARSR